MEKSFENIVICCPNGVDWDNSLESVYAKNPIELKKAKTGGEKTSKLDEINKGEI